MPPLTPISNRAADGSFKLPEDGWYHVIPRGDFPHYDCAVLQVIDDPAVESILNRFSQDSKAPHFPGLLIDQEHFGYSHDGSSEAWGWIRELQNRADGVWGRIQWTDAGEAAVKNGRYRFISPTWLKDDTEQIGPGRVRPLRLDTAGLTNHPNLTGMVPLSNRAQNPDFRQNASASAADTQKQHNQNRMKSIATALGLSADASEEAILAEVKKLQSQADTAKKQVEPMTNRISTLEAENTALKTDNSKLLADQVEQDLEKYKNRFAPEKRDEWKKALIANRATGIALLDSIPVPGAAGQNTMHNRANAGTPSGNPGAAGADAGKAATARAKRISNRAAQIEKEQGVPYSVAFNLAKGEFPEE